MLQQPFRMASPAEEKLSDSLGWPLFTPGVAQGARAGATNERTPYNCGPLHEYYQATPPLQTTDECGSKRKAFNTDVTRPATLKAVLLQRINHIAWHQHLARLRRSGARAHRDDDSGSRDAASPLAVLSASVVPPPPPSSSSSAPLDADLSAVPLAALPTSAAAAFPLLRPGNVATAAQIDAFFSRLASTATEDSLSALAPLVQVGFPKDQKLVEALVSRTVPLSRAVWLLRVLHLLSGTAHLESVKASADAVRLATARLTDNVVKALTTRLNAPLPAAADGEWQTRTIYLVRLIEWLRAERLLDERALFATLVGELDASAVNARKTAVLCYVLQPLLLLGARPPETQLLNGVIDRLGAMAQGSLGGAVARGLRALLRTALLMHPTLASNFVLEPTRRAAMHQLLAPPVPHTDASGAVSLALPSLPPAALLQAHLFSATATASLALKSTAAAASSSADETARELYANECILLPFSALAAYTLDRLPLWLDAFAGAQRFRRQLLPFGLSMHLGERRVRELLRRVFEWAVTPRRGGRDRPYVAALAAEVALDTTGVQCSKAPAPVWVQQIVLRFIEDCVARGPAFADFDVLVRLLGDLLRRRVFAYSQYEGLLIRSAFAPRLRDAAAAAAGARLHVPDAHDAIAPLAQVGSADALLGAAQRAAEALLRTDESQSDAAQLARHVFIVRQTPILDRGDDAGVLADRNCRTSLLRARVALEDATRNAMQQQAATGAIDTAALPLHEQICVAKDVAAQCLANWATQTPQRVQAAIQLVERVGCLVTLVDALYGMLLQCVREPRTVSACEDAVIGALRRHETAFVWCDRAADLRSALSRQQRHRSLLDAFQHRFSGALPAIEQSVLAGKAQSGARKIASAAVQALQLAEQARAAPACVAMSTSGTAAPPASAAAALAALARGLGDDLLPTPASAIDWAIAASGGDASAAFREAVQSGAFARLLALAAGDARGATTSAADETSDGVAFSSKLLPLIDGAVLAPSLIGAAVDWRVGLPRAVVVSVLRADPWNVATNASVLRACCDAAASDAAFVDTLPAPLPPLVPGMAAGLARVHRLVARMVLATCVLQSDAALRARVAGDAASAPWAAVRPMLLLAGGTALLGAVLREALQVLSDDALLFSDPYRLPLDLVALWTGSHALSASVALHDAVAHGLVRLLVPVIRELRASSAPQSALALTQQQLVRQLRKWHQMTTSYVDVVVETDERISALHSALLLRLELAASAITPIRAAHATCSRECVCGSHALFDALVDITANQVARTSATDDDTLMLMCTGALRCLTNSAVDGAAAAPTARDLRLSAALQAPAAVPAFVDGDDNRVNDERRKPLPPWSQVEGFLSIQSAVGLEAPVLHARTLPRYVVVVQPSESSDTLKRSASTSAADELFKRSKQF
jgi:hypothetical protein